MDFPRLPLADFLGLEEDPEGKLALPFNERVRNHLGTAHAGAQFVLAETASGKCLFEAFPDLYGATLPVLRRAEVTYRGAGTSDLHAHASIDAESQVRFRKELTERGRSLIMVKVSVTDRSGKETLRASCEWFVQGLPGNPGAGEVPTQGSIRDRVDPDRR